MRSTRMNRRGLVLVVAAASLALSGCSADYLNHRDTITLQAGDAVEANLHKETINPSAGYMYNTGGLGADGGVIPDDSTKGGSTVMPSGTGGNV